MCSEVSNESVWQEEDKLKTWNDERISDEKITQTPQFYKKSFVDS